jgi:glutamate racemase
LFVEHVEAGDTTSDELREAARGYLAPLKEAGIDTLILGCTHYPLLSGLLQLELGPDVVLVSSAEETAKDVYATLVQEGLATDDSELPHHEFLSTGDAETFRAVGDVFLGGHELARVEAVHLEKEGSWS